MAWVTVWVGVSTAVRLIREQKDVLIANITADSSLRLLDLPLRNQISKNLPGFGIPTRVPERNRYPNIVAVFAMAVISLTLSALGGFKMLMVFKIKERMDLRRGDEQDVSPSAAVPAIGSAEGFEPLPPETDTTFPPVSGANECFGLINKLQRRPGLTGGGRPWGRPASALF